MRAGIAEIFDAFSDNVWHTGGLLAVSVLERQLLSLKQAFAKGQHITEYIVP